MSDSDETPEPSSRLPSERDISLCLYRIVRDALKQGAEITTRQARSTAETELGLEVGFFKSDAYWNAKSKEVLTQAVKAPQSIEKPQVVAKAVAKRKSNGAQRSRKKQKKAASTDDEQDGLEEDGNRASDDGLSEEDQSIANVEPAMKRKSAGTKSHPEKKSTSDHARAGDGDEGPMEVSTSTKPSKVSGKVQGNPSAGMHRESPTAVLDTSDEDDERRKELPSQDDHSNEEAEDDGKSAGTGKDKYNDRKRSEPDHNNVDPGNESEYSIVFDEAPARKRRSKTPASTKPTNINTTTKSVTKTIEDAKTLSPEDEEVKRLQGWLVKCGIRKLWHKELASYNTAKQKIKHLKNMLSEAGMAGRYSVEKARSIKEARELKEEIEAAQEFNKKWGEKSGDDDEDDGEVKSVDENGRSRGTSRTALPSRQAKRLPKGLVDFGDDDDDDSE